MIYQTQYPWLCTRFQHFAVSHSRQIIHLSSPGLAILSESFVVNGELLRLQSIKN